MTYAIGGVILASEFNSMINGGTIQNGVSVGTATPLAIAPGLNTAWSVGAASAGYGQPAFATVAVGQTVRARPATVVSAGPGTVPTWSATPEWRALVDTVNNMSLHQVGAPAPITATNYNTPVRPAAAGLPVAGVTTPAIITWADVMGAAINTVSSTRRLNAALQGATTANTFTTTGSWSDLLNFTFSVNFGSHDKARYFFNSGGQIGFNTSHPAGGTFNINQLISQLCADMGTSWISSTNGTPATVTLAGTSYTGVTKIGGGNPGGATINQNNGFYAMSGGTTQFFNQKTSFAYHAYTAGTNINLSGTYNNAGLLTFTLSIDEIPNGAVVSAGTAATILVRYPSTTYLANTWGTAAVAGSYTAV